MHWMSVVFFSFGGCRWILLMGSVLAPTRAPPLRDAAADSNPQNAGTHKPKRQYSLLSVSGMFEHNVRCKGEFTSYRLLPTPRVIVRTSSNTKASGLTRTHTHTHCATRPTKNTNTHVSSTPFLPTVQPPATNHKRVSWRISCTNCHDCFNLHALQCTKTHITKTPGQPCACRPGTGRKGPWWPSTRCSTTSPARTARWGRARGRTTPKPHCPAKYI